MIAFLSAVGSTPDWAHKLGRAVDESSLMFWTTLWALILGFGASGMVRGFVSSRTVAGRLGRRDPRSEFRASLYGMASSSCSYAAGATTRTLLGRGADLVVATIYLVASTNLVLELGLVLLALIGWQFLAGEFVGGFVMIVLIALLAGGLLRGRRVEAEVAQVRAEIGDVPGVAEDAETGSFRARLALALRFAQGDVKMLRKEILIGFFVAGLLTEYVPTSVWTALFVPGHGVWTSAENALIGPGIALVSFVCSIGNVPLAAALWKGGMSFAGVSSFLFADLISLPVLLSYRRLFGRAITLRLLLLFWPVMSVAGFAVGELVDAVGIQPRPRPGQIASSAFGFNLTTLADVLALVLIAIVIQVSRGARPTVRVAKDPVCGMEVETSLPGATTEFQGRIVYFCSPGCRDRFLADPEQFDVSALSAAPDHATAATNLAIDPICGMEVDPENAAARREHDGVTYFFCCQGCAEQFDRTGPRSPGAMADHSPHHAGAEQNEVRINLRRPPS